MHTIKQHKVLHAFAARAALGETIRTAFPVDPLGEALNSGDGSYRP